VFTYSPEIVLLICPGWGKTGFSSRERIRNLRKPQDIIQV